MLSENKVAMYLANNLVSLRKRKNLSQDQLSKLAQIPRSTLTHIESGAGNPSLQNLIKLSSALQIGVEELLSRPRNECELRQADEIQMQKRSQGTVRVYKLLPEKIKGLDVDRLEMNKGAKMIGHPHLSGAKEYLSVVQGEITVQVAGDLYRVTAGSVLAFPGDQSHTYQASGKGPALALSIVVPVTLGVD